MDQTDTALMSCPGSDVVGQRRGLIVWLLNGLFQVSRRDGQILHDAIELHPEHHEALADVVVKLPDNPGTLGLLCFNLGW
jgi:hypothetical protein